MWWAFAGAGVAAVAYGSATILQALSVRRLVALGPGASARARLPAGYLYAAGLALDLLGFLASLAALRRLPLFLVESAVAASVAVTAVLAVLVLGVRLRRLEVGALAATVAGLVALAVTAREGAAHPVGSAAGWLLLVSAAVVALLVLAGVRAAGRPASPVVLAVASGLGFGIVGISARTLQVRTPWRHTVADPVLWAVLAHGALATIAYGLALHRGRATTVAAVTFAVETVLPAAIGLAFLGDAVRPHLAPVAAAGFVATVVGSVLLAAHAEPEQAVTSSPPDATVMRA